MAEASIRLPSDTQNHLVFSFGVNDTATDEASAETAKQIIADAQSIGKVLFVGPPAVIDAEHNKRIFKLNEQLKTLNCPFVDIFGHLQNNQQWQDEILQNDGFHPKSSGYSIISQIVQQSSHWWFK